MSIEARIEIGLIDDPADREDVTEELISHGCSVRFNEEGNGNLVVPYGTTLARDPLGNPIYVFLNDTEVAAWVGEAVETVEVDEAEESEMISTYSGRGLASLLDRVRCLPTFGPGKQPWGLTRVFGALSPEFDVELWSNATEYDTISDVSTHWNQVPTKFPGLDVKRIGPSSGTTTQAPQGYWWTRTSFTLASSQVVRFFFAADNAADIYIDGFPIVKLDEGADTLQGYINATEYRIRLTAGTHVVGAKVINVPFGGGDPGPGEGPTLVGNPSMFMCLGMIELGSGELTYRVVESSSDWKILEYPDEAPGFTEYQVIDILLNEAELKGVLPTFTTVVHDYADFDIKETITVRVGDSLLKHLRDRADGGWLDWRVPPDSTYELHLWMPGERGTASGVEYNPEETVVDLRSRTVEDGTDCVLVTYKNGHTLVPPSGGERMSYLSTQCESLNEARLLGDAVRNLPDRPTAITVVVAPTEVDDIPGIDVLDGDKIDVGDHTDEVMIAWSMAYDGTYIDSVAFSVELKDKIRAQQERINTLLARYAPGSVGGVTPSAPAGEPPRLPLGLSSSPFRFQPLKYPVDDADDVYYTGFSPESRPATSGNIFAVRAECTVAGTTDTEFEIYVQGINVVFPGTLPAGELVVILPIVWIDGDSQVRQTKFMAANQTVLRANLTVIGTGIDGIIFELITV